jgi:peptidoglycan/LPS O-acetylase OafA/YrhL
LKQGGWIGVDLFFVLSGYLVSNLIFRELTKTGGFNAKRFLIRRGLKIYPAFYFFLAFTIASQIVFNRPIETIGIWGEITYLQNYIGRLWPHTWSLAVEEHFYILLTIVCVYTIKVRKFKIFKTLLLFLLIAPLGSRIVIYYQQGFISYDQLMYPTHLRIDSLTFGVLLSYLKIYENQRFKVIKHWASHPISFVVAVGVISLNFIIPIQHPYISTVGFSINYLMFGLLLIWSINNEELYYPEWIVKIGYYSYSIYLWHFLFRDWPMLFTQNMLSVDLPVSVASIIYMLGGIFSGIFFAKLIEIPILNLRNKLFPSLSK